MALLRLAEEKDIPQIKKIADADKKCLGFISRAWLGASIAKEELHIAVLDGEVVGFIRWHKRRDGMITIYDLCVAERFRRKNIGQQLVSVLGDSYLRLKCHQDNPARDFYKRLGFEVVGLETSKGGRKLNIFERNNVPF
ncbi:MAG: GNAT family N-acetyltransferase [Candidatus Yanofskybacteria bacterium]|nr:GNAT family N-acetyltransferase [Candidatus Yanofskybacteria bacterium]